MEKSKDIIRSILSGLFIYVGVLITPYGMCELTRFLFDDKTTQFTMVYVICLALEIYLLYVYNNKLDDEKEKNRLKTIKYAEGISNFIKYKDKIDKRLRIKEINAYYTVLLIEDKSVIIYNNYFADIFRNSEDFKIISDYICSEYDRLKNSKETIDEYTLSYNFNSHISTYIEEIYKEKKKEGK